MIGLIKKDLFMIKNNYKTILIALLIYIFYTVEFDMNMFFFLPFMGLMICISTINYDDFNNFHTYAASLPKGKSGVVKSKYITTTSVVLILSILSLLISIVIGKIKGNISFSESLETITGLLFVMVFMMSILFPILFKFGAEKGRIAMILIGILTFGIVMFFTKFVKLNISKNFINFIDSYYLVLFIVGSVLIILLSYKVSQKIYLKREF